jgi:2-hydroxychromene-2-carboxylate isomerase
LSTVQFFFGVGSRYSYLASTQAPKLARETGARFVWRAVDSRELIKRAGPDPFGAGARGQYKPAYRTQDATRWADYYGVAYREPPWDEVDWKALALACVAADALGAGEAYATRLFAKCFGDGRPPQGDRDLADLGHPDLALRDRFREALRSPATVERHQRNLDDALEAGAFGVPTFVVDDGESFWGQDRLPLLRRHLMRLASSGR